LSTVNIVDLRSYALQNLVGTHHCPTFVHAARLPLLPLATYVRAPHLPSTPLNCVRTPCRTLSVRTAVLHSYLLRVCRHYHWLHSYVLLVCRQHRRPAFVRVSKPRCYPLLSYIRTCCSSAVDIVDLCSYALQKLVGTYCSPTFVCAARMQSTPLTCVRTCCRTSLVHTAVLHSYMLRVCRHFRWLHSYMLLVCRQHRRPAFVCVAKPRWYALLSYIRTRCSYAVNTADLRSYALQNLVGMHGCPTFVYAAHLPPLPLARFIRAARLPLTSSTCVRTRCRTSLVHTAVLHSYMLRVCHHCRCLHSSSAVNIVYQRSYTLQILVGTHCCPTFVRAARKQSTPLTCIHTRCRTSLVHTAVLHSYMLRVCRHCCWLHSYVLLVCHQHRRPAFVRVAKPRWYPLLS